MGRTCEKVWRGCRRPLSIEKEGPPLILVLLEDLKKGLQNIGPRNGGTEGQRHLLTYQTSLPAAALR